MSSFEYFEQIPLLYAKRKQGKDRGMKVSTSTIAALFSKMAVRGQRIAMVDMVLLVFPALPYLPQGWMEPEFPSEDFLFLLSGWWWW